MVKKATTAGSVGADHFFGGNFECLAMHAFAIECLATHTLALNRIEMYIYHMCNECKTERSHRDSNTAHPAAHTKLNLPDPNKEELSN